MVELKSGRAADEWMESFCEGTEVGEMKALGFGAPLAVVMRRADVCQSH